MSKPKSEIPNLKQVSSKESPSCKLYEQELDRIYSLFETHASLSHDLFKFYIDMQWQLRMVKGIFGMMILMWICQIILNVIFYKHLSN